MVTVNLSLALDTTVTAVSGSAAALNPAPVSISKSMTLPLAAVGVGSAAFVNLSIIFIANSYVPSSTPNYYLTDDDFLPLEDGPVKITRKRQADAFNQVQIECLDRNNDYNPVVVEAKDQANIEQFGLRPMALIQFHAICLPSIALIVAQLILQRALYLRNTYEFVLGWNYGRLEPMDLVALTDIALGLNQQVVRILSIQEDAEGQLAFTAEDFTVGVSSVVNNPTQNTTGFQPNRGVSAGNCITPTIFQPPTTLAGTSQVWLGTSGAAGTDWGGAQIWVSNDGNSYQQVGTVTNPARMGTLTANFPTGSDPDLVNTLSANLAVSSGVLTSATNVQADGGTTLSYCDGELVAYTTANLTANYTYSMANYIRRGQYQTPINTHLTGTKFLRLDDAVAKIDLPAAWVGTVLYIKLLSFNSTGGGLQALSDVAAYNFTPISEGFTPADGIRNSLDVGQQLTIPSGYQYNVTVRFTNRGRIVNFGHLRITS